jgi:hypothetical protein
VVDLIRTSHPSILRPLFRNRSAGGGGGGAAGWTYANLTTLQALYDASQQTDAADTLYSRANVIAGLFKDWSGNGYHAETTFSGATVGAQLKTGILNGYSVFRLTGTDGPQVRLPAALTTAMNTNSEGTFWWVFQSSVQFDRTAPIDASPRVQDDDVYQYSGDNNTYLGTGRTTRPNMGNIFGSNTQSSWHIVVIRSKAGLWEMRLNGTVVSTTATNTFGMPTNVWLFGPGGGFTPAAGDHALAGMSNISETTATVEKIEGYPAAKYGLQSVLPIGHTYKSTAP